ncbi:MAG: [NiFe]-hydrogenase assembly chaperone HybE [Pseudomonadota bacterium]|nr:[NiFe]-hydrogenase assembly chaperone HybE [Pseudomonadota bacterium]
MICPEELSEALEAAFVGIQRERMVDVPILNPALKVEAVGFREWDGCCLGVLVTPWFMNLMLLPGNRDEWADLPPGTKIDHVFPSGNYEFILGEEERIGRYQMCSLFSPVFEFQDQEAAVATAGAVMEGLMDQGNRDGTPTHERGKRPTTEEGLARRMSRRDLLRGRFSAARE